MRPAAPAWQTTRRGTVELPPAVEEVLGRFLREKFPKATRPRLEESVAELSETFTAERGTLPGSYLNQPPLRSAYLAFVHPQQMLRGVAAIAEVLARAAARGLEPRGGARVLDLGAGLGAMTQAFLLAGGGAAEITLLDHQRGALVEARDLTLRIAGVINPSDAPAAPPPRVRTAADRLEPWLRRARDEGWRYDVVLMGGLWNEFRDDWGPILRQVIALLDPRAPGGGLGVIVEPAIPAVARRLQTVRDTLLDATTTIAPCTHGLGCPLLRLRRDWCFTIRPARLPDRTTSLAAALGHQTHEVRYALWAFTPRPAAAPFELPEPDHARVLSESMEGEQVLCLMGERERVRTPSPPFTRGDLVSRR